MKLTTKQTEVYNLIKKFIKEKGYSPTIRELCKILGLNSSASIHRHLKILKQKGYITYEEGKSRTIKILNL